MTRAKAKDKPQHELGETVVENTELLALLEERETLKQGKADYEAANKRAKEMLAGIETPAPFRVGRFVISRQATAPKTVSFDTPAGFRLNIKADE